MRFSVHSEKSEVIGEIGEVQRVHQTLYKDSVGNWGEFMAPNRE